MIDILYLRDLDIEKLVTKNAIFRRIGEGPNLLLLHGGAGCWLHWAKNIRELSKHFTLYLPDMPGMGESPDVPVETSSMADFMSLFSNAVSEMFPSGEMFHVAGFSLGGLCSARLAECLPEQVLSVTMICPGGYKPGGHFRLDLKKPKENISAADLEALHRHNIQLLLIHDKAKIDDITLMIQRYNIENARFNGRKIGYLDHFENFLEQVKCPIMLIFGDKDPVPKPTPQSHIDYISNYAQIDELHILSEVGHWANYEAPERVDPLIQTFITKLELAD